MAKVKRKSKQLSAKSGQNATIGANLKPMKLPQISATQMKALPQMSATPMKALPQLTAKTGGDSVSQQVEENEMKTQELKEKMIAEVSLGPTETTEYTTSPVAGGKNEPVVFKGGKKQVKVKRASSGKY